MGGIAGYFNRDGQPAKSELLSRMLGSTHQHGLDGTVMWLEGALAMGQHIHKTLPEPGAELPFRDDAAGVLVTLDGRVDNLGELCAELAVRGLPVTSGTDAECILRAYEAWGDDCAVHVIGEFAFALFDMRRRQLLLGRDALGVRPLYYVADATRIRWGSDLRHVLEDRSVPRRPNEGMVGEYLADHITRCTETLWEGVLRLPQAHVLTLDARQMRVRRYWEPTLKLLRYRSDSEYSEHFGEVFTEAVRCRLRAVGPIACDLSGGLDSSSILCIANSLADAGEGPPEGIEAYTLIFPGRPDADETFYSDAVVATTGVTQLRVLPAERPLAHYADEARQTLDLPSAPNGTMHLDQFILARDRHCRVRLSGFGGDQRLNGSAAMYADFLHAGQLRRAARELSANGQEMGWLDAVYGAGRAALPQFLPRRLKRPLRARFRRARVPEWISPVFAGRIGLVDRLQSPRIDDLEFESHTQRARYSFLRDGFEAFVLEWDRRTTSSLGLDSRFPFYDRRLVEFALRLPPDQQIRSGYRKYVLRQFMGDRLPECVRGRRSKGDFSHVSVHAIEAAGGAGFFSRITDQLRSWVLPERLMAMAMATSDRFQRGENEYFEFIHPLWQAISIELWLRAANEGAPPSHSRAAAEV